ncbi:MAG: threonine dehydratase [Phenylobacterium sp.]|jgi:threonine dehydratase
MALPLPSKTKVGPKRDYFQQIMLASIYDLAVETDLSKLEKVSKKLDNQVWLKREDMQPVNSFKLRGAHNKIKQLTSEQKSCGVVTASAGNHAQGVALSGASLGIKATIVMPITTPEIKVTAVRGHGGKVILHGESFDEANDYAQQLAKTEGATFIPPFDDADVIVGQGTIAKELLQQNPNIERVFIPVGGGGLLAGMGVYIKTLLPEVQVIGVEFEESACLKVALEAGKPVSLAHVGQFADGVAVRKIGNETFKLAQLYCDEVITVTSDEICAAIKDIYNDVRAIPEPSGALSLAGLTKYLQQHNLHGTQAAAILSGANMNFDTLRYISERTALGEKTEAVLAVTVDERPGSFRHFCEDIGDRVITEFNYRYCDGNKAQIFVGIRLTEGAAELAQIHQLLRDKGYAFTDLSDDEFSKQHVRYMVGGKPKRALVERVYHFEFPEHRGALSKFLTAMGDRWNISLFHYRNHGSAIGEVLAAFEVSEAQELAFHRFLKELGYSYLDQTHNAGYRLFLQH